MPAILAEVRYLCEIDGTESRRVAAFVCDPKTAQVRFAVQDGLVERVPSLRDSTSPHDFFSAVIELDGQVESGSVRFEFTPQELVRVPDLDSAPLALLEDGCLVP